MVPGLRYWLQEVGAALAILVLPHVAPAATPWPDLVRSCL